MDHIILVNRTFGTFGVFSFHGSKTISTGGSGMLVTNNEEIFKKS